MTLKSVDKPKILVADDDIVIRDLFERFLTKRDYVVSTAYDGLDAMDKIKKENYDVVLLDLKMPKMEGMHVFFGESMDT